MVVMQVGLFLNDLSLSVEFCRAAETHRSEREHGPVEPARFDPSNTVGSFREGGSSLAVRGLQPIVEANRWLFLFGLSGVREVAEGCCRGYYC